MMWDDDQWEQVKEYCKKEKKAHISKRHSSRAITRELEIRLVKSVIMNANGEKQIYVDALTFDLKFADPSPFQPS